MKVLLVKKATGRGVGASILTQSLVDNKVQYVGKRIRASAVVNKVVGTAVPKVEKMHNAVLLVQGDKPGFLAYPVKWDGKDMYGRVFASGQMKFGSLSALNSTGNENYSAKIITMGDLVNMVAKRNTPVTVTRVNDDTEHTLFLFNSIGDKYIVALEMEGGKPAIRNIEHVEHYNRKCPFRITNPKAAPKVDVRKTLGSARVSA
jgi:hypothetical protein